MWTSVNQRMTFRGWELGPVKGSTITTKAQSLPILRIVYNLQWEIPVILADIHTEQVQINVQLHYMSLLVYTYLLKFEFETRKSAFVNLTQICSWDQAVLSNEGMVSCSRKQLEPLMELELMTDRHLHYKSIVLSTTQCSCSYTVLFCFLFFIGLGTYSVPMF